MVKKLILLLLPLTLILNTKTVYANDVSTFGIGQSIAVVDNTTTSYVKTISGNPWSSLAGTSGYIRGSFGLYKVDGTATSINIMPKQVYVNTNTNPQSYVCNIESPTIINSTFNGGTYSYTCPVKMGTSGITSLVIEFFDIQTNYTSQSRLVIGSLMTYEVFDNVNVNVDTSGTTSAINNQINNDNTNTQSVINNQNTNTQNIINNQDSNTQDIIDNQNQNTNKQIESEKVCSIVNKNNVVINGKFLDSSGNLYSPYNTDWGVTDYIKISSSTITVLRDENSSNPSLCFYNANKGLISCRTNSSFNLNSNLLIPTGATYVRFSILTSSDVPQFQICKNGNQAIVDTQEENTNAINDVNDTLKDDSSPDVDNYFSGFDTDSNSPVSDLITMPITLLQAYINGFSSECSSFNLGTLFGHTLIMPCINIEDFLGSNLWSLIDILFCIYLCFNIGMLCVSIYEGITSLDDAMQYLYTPEHTGHSRVSRNEGLY